MSAFWIIGNILAEKSAFVVDHLLNDTLRGINLVDFLYCQIDKKGEVKLEILRHVLWNIQSLSIARRIEPTSLKKALLIVRATLDYSDERLVTEACFCL